ncbi:MAG: ABC transporter permease [Rhodothermales bacterium]
MFDLDKTLSTWRNSYKLRRAFSTEDMDELEQHLRDEIDELVEKGFSPQMAFERAIKDMGSWDTAEKEYGKVFWSKAKREHRLQDEINWRYSMLKNYLMVALRTMRKQKIYTVINILGLAAGLACFILIMLFVQHEFSYDQFYDNAEDIYRVTKRNPGDVYLGTDHFALTQAPLATTMTQDFTEVALATSFEYHEALLGYQQTLHSEKGLWGDQHFFEVFSLELIAGNPATALASPNAIVLTAALAEKFFGKENPLGKILVVDNEKGYQITGLIADVPENSSIQYSFITSVVSSDYYNSQVAESRWNSNYMYTFFTLAKGAKIDDLQAKMPAFTNRYLYTGRDDVAVIDREQFFFQKLKDVHLISTANFDVGRHGSLTQVYMFLAIGIVILLLACINYVNLAIARSIRRAAEVGLRKTVGAIRPQLIVQFIGESIFMAFLALLLAIGLVHLLLPFFSTLVERSLELNYLDNPWAIPGLFSLLILVAGISGSYPAFLMASLHPIEVLKRKKGGSTSGFSMQNTLVVGQFMASIVLVTCGYVIYQQLNYVRNSEMGYDREHILNIALHGNDNELSSNIKYVQESLLRNAAVSGVTAARSLPTNISMQQSITEWEGSDVDDELPLHVNPVDYNYEEVFGIQLVAGRSFSPDVTTDGDTACLINETTAKALGWTAEEAIGQSFRHDRKMRIVIGVMKDFHLHSMHHAIKPLLFYLDNGSRFKYISAKVSPGNLPETISFVRSTVQESSAFPFEYQFLDENFDQLYAQDARLGKTFSFFTILAFLIASLGLFGLAAYAAEQRTKEIGVRKALGASSRSIVVMLSKEFALLVLIASCLATPIAYFATQRWLEGFAYSITVGPKVFIMATLITLTIAILSVGYQSLKAAFANPVRSLRFNS